MSSDTFLTRGSSVLFGSAPVGLIGHYVKVTAKVRNANDFRLVRIKVITSDCLSDYGSSILPRVANFLPL